MKAIFAFSGDPIHYGHIDIIERATKVFELTVAIGVNPDKKYLFTKEERLDMTKKALTHLSNIEVTFFEGLLVDYAYEKGISYIVKGIRDDRDFNYETMLKDINESQRKGIETFFLPTNPYTRHISSTAIKGLQKEHGLVHEYVPLYIKQKLEERVSGQYMLGVTGEIGSGKSHVSERLKEIGVSRNMEVYNIELDHIAHQILEVLEDRAYVDLREEIAKAFGSKVKNEDGFINRKNLGDVVFSDKNKLKKLNELMYEPIRTRLRREIYNKKGLILLNAALLLESDLLYLSNNNIVLVGCDKESQTRRLKERGLNSTQITTRLTSQYNHEKKRKKILKKISKDDCGKLWMIDNSDGANPSKLEKLFNQVCTGLEIK